MTIDYDLIDDYLADRLDEPQLESFEIDLLDNEELQQAVLSQRALRQGLAAQEGSAFKKKAPGFWLTEWLTRPAWAYAATLLLGVSLGAHWLRDGRDSSRIDRIVYLETVRGASGPTYTLQQSENHLLVVDVSPTATGPFKVDIASNGKLVEQQSFAKATNYSLKIILPDLPPAVYTLSLQDGESANEFSFEVVE